MAGQEQGKAKALALEQGQAAEELALGWSLGQGQEPLEASQRRYCFLWLG